MAQVISANIYKLNSNDPYPLSTVTALAFGTASIIIRAIPATLALLSTGVYCYSAIQTANGSQYYCVETQAALVTAANA